MANEKNERATTGTRRARQPLERSAARASSDSAFLRRLRRHHDELRWLYMELYDNGAMFAELCDRMRAFYVESPDSLRARDARREGHAGDRGRVDVDLSRRQERAVLSVRNTGEPIPPEHLEHLFERFYRVDGSRSRKEGGYGLGLAIAHTIVQSHRGQIEVRSSREEGTVFAVTLPHGRMEGKFPVF